MKKFTFFLLLPLFFLSPADAVSPDDQVITTKVISVYDGDTFTVVIDGKEEKIRLLGVDTPEMKPYGNKTTCRSDEAKAFTSALILNKSVTLERDPQNDNRDRFGRLLRSVKLNNRLDISILLLITGNAAVYDKADFAQKPLYKKLEKRAQAAKRGIWGECGGLMLSPESSPSVTASPTPSPLIRSCSVVASCSRLTTCEDARYFLTTCGQRKLDGDGDGNPCEDLCKPTPTPVPSATPKPTATPKPKATPIILPEETETPGYKYSDWLRDSATSGSSDSSCGSAPTCSAISSCSEAYHYLNDCGVSRLDGDGDGVPCESLCG